MERPSRSIQRYQAQPPQRTQPGALTPNESAQLQQHYRNAKLEKHIQLNADLDMAHNPVSSREYQTAARKRTSSVERERKIDEALRDMTSRAFNRNVMQQVKTERRRP